MSQRISYPVADHVRIHVTKNILRGEYQKEYHKNIL